MKKAQILHNPEAGKQEHSKKELISMIESKGFECGYSSTKGDGWKKLRSKTDFLVVAGGDGTVRQVALKLIKKRKLKKKPPLLLLPLGTANNIAKSLGIEGHVEEIMRKVDKDRIKNYDIGVIKGLKEEHIFLESFGYGIFPELMNRMKDIPEREDAAPEENIRTALQVLYDIIINFPANPFNITIDGVMHSENYLLVEVMNITSIGPNLNLSLSADPSDGEFEVVLVPERQREEFASYVSYKISGIEKSFMPVTIKGKKITISTGPGNVHIDDELIAMKKAKKVKIKPEPGMMRFFVQ